jgi:hypothetical protein
MTAIRVDSAVRPRRAPALTALGIALLLVIAAIHVLVLRGYLRHHPAVAWLFIADSAGALMAAAGLAANLRGAWSLSALVAALPAIGFVLSRTVGLPTLHDDDWMEFRAGVPVGLICLVAEVALVALYLTMVMGSGGGDRRRATGPASAT